jgi:flagellar hook-associated protein 2
MGSIISTGVGSGLDVNGLVKKLVEAEGAQKSARLDTAEAKAQAKLSALGSLRAALAGFRDTVAKLKSVDAFRGRQATVSKDDFISATATTTAAPTSYSVEVDRLAAAHKLQSATPFSSAAAVIGTGTLAIKTAGVTYNVTIDGTNNTVDGIASAINSSQAGEKVIASVITGANGAATLTITARNSGAANAITITQSGGDGGLAQIAYPASGGSGLAQIKEALDARAFIDGVEVTSATNTISGAIAGVDISLLEANDDGETTLLTVGYDKEGAKQAVGDFVKSYNALVDAIKSVSSYDVQTKTGGPLFGDAGLRNITYQLRREMSSSVLDADPAFDMLNKIGVTVALDGKLAVDAGKLDSAMSTNFDAVGKLFATPDIGIAIKVDQLLDPYLQTGGVFDNRNDSLKSSIAEIDDQREALNLRLEALQARYLKQFNALDGLLAQLSQTSNFLSQQLSQLPGATFKDN